MKRILLLLLTVVFADSANAQTRAADARAAVETQLVPAVLLDSREVGVYPLRDRMAHYNVPGLSVAVMDSGRIIFARGYGLSRAGGTDSVTNRTLFQAASISKPVAAAGALRLVEDGRIELAADVNRTLRTWRLPATAYTAFNVVTLRSLLTHTAGLTVHGFPGYARGVALPSVTQILDGGAPANTAAIRNDTIPGARWKYSGGGYTLAQLLMQDVTATAFDQLMHRLVLAPAGMTHSTYAQPLPDALHTHAASGHHASGTVVPGEWHTYPEQAAAGLWTTPSDLLRFALAINASYRGEHGALLSQPTARAMLTEVMGGWGIGPGVAGTGAALRFSHGGANEGFRAFFVAYPETGRGIAVMTNSDFGGPIGMEIVRAVARAFDWPDFKPRTQAVTPLEPSALAAWAGDYVIEKPIKLRATVRVAADHLELLASNGYRFTLYPVTAERFVAIEDGSTVTFENAAGEATIRLFGLSAKRELKH